jgi:hypothetical protein
MAKAAFEWTKEWRRLAYFIEERKGIKYIVATRNSDQEEYDPIQLDPPHKQPKQRDEHSKSTPHIALARLDSNSEDKILEFVNRWGLLGLWYVPHYTSIEYIRNEDDKESLLKEDNLTWFRHPHKNGRYGWREPLAVFKQAVMDYQEDLENINGKETNEERALVTDLRVNRVLEGCSPATSWYKESQKRVNGWRFNSLLSAIYLRTLLDHQAGILKKCRRKNCSKIFSSRNPVSEYCSEPCKKAFHTQASRNKSITLGILQDYEHINQKWLEEQINDLVGRGISGEKRLRKEIAKLIEYQS